MLGTARVEQTGGDLSPCAVQYLCAPRVSQHHIPYRTHAPAMQVIENYPNYLNVVFVLFLPLPCLVQCSWPARVKQPVDH